ncbi:MULTISPECIES: hypothetical protein [unclassified Streptomyces]|uniref:hypothetical protein n=1 Tax=unclassified Streptomyces TaxID=2593676 RepID=UPI002E2C2DBC|nr:hypothetical protein [Streptomyces sp. NBC_00228]
MESVEPPEDDVTPDEDVDVEDEEDVEVELSDVDEVLEEADGEGVEDDDELLVPVLLAAVSASASDCTVPTRAKAPAAAASVIAAVAAAMRRFPLRTAVAAPRSSTVMTVPLRSDALSRPTVGDQPERSL